MVDFLAEALPREKEGIQAFVQRVQGKFGSRAVGFRLFGSKVRNEAWEESDTDILVLVTGAHWREKNWIIDLSTDINLEYDLMLSPLVMTPEEFEKLLKRERRIACDIEKEGIPL
ncbi:MAG: nucleotidyltransferase domain-containing protein [Deltaproteobacteria bacterium]|nr:nucleotidyltransferase domain-containing protein [Deltaproteobacteria bacterium]